MSTTKPNCARNWSPSLRWNSFFFAISLSLLLGAWPSEGKGQTLDQEASETDYPPVVSEWASDKKTLESLYQMLKETDINNHQRILQLSEAIIPLAEAEKDEFKLFATLNLRGVTHSIRGEVPDALYHYRRAFKIAENKEGDWISYRLKVAINLSAIYDILRDKEKALHYARENLQLATQLNQEQLLPPIYQSLALFFRESQPDSSLYYSEKAIEGYRALQDKLWEVKTLITKAHTLVLVGQLEPGRSILTSLEDSISRNPDLQSLEKEWLHPMALLERKSGNYRKSVDLELKKIREDLSAAPSVLQKSYLNLAESYQALGKLDSSLHYFRQYHELKEEIAREDLLLSIQSLEVDFALQQKEVEINLLEEINEKNRRMIQMLLLGLLAVLGLFAIIFWIYLKGKSKNRTLRILKDKLAIYNKILFYEVETRRNFIQLVIHNIRTPLMGAQLNLVNLLSNTQGSKERKTLEEISNHVQIIEEGISKILSSELEKAQHPYCQREQFTVQTIVSKSIKEYRTLARTRYIKITYAHAGEKSLAWADPYLFQYALENLLSNALRYSPPGTTVQVLSSEQPHCIRVEVRDQGRGIPDQKLDSLFEDQMEALESFTLSYDSWGRGLALAKSFLLETGGKIYLESTGETGSCFVIEIPKR
jgi:signal transduction histidine kinase